MKYMLLITAVSMVALACKKSEHPAPPQYHELHGTLYLPDYYGGTGTYRPLPNKLVYIDTSASTDTSNHSNSVLTDSKGNFTFYLNNEKDSYHIWSFLADTSSSTFAPFYSAIRPVNAPIHPDSSYDLKLSVESQTRNGIYLVTIDKDGSPLPRSLVIYYRSQPAAERDVKFTGGGSSFKVVTDSMGRAFLSQVPAFPYYVNAVLAVSFDSLRSINASVIVPERGIVKDTIILQ